jgi:molecular chaperone HtpG
VTDAEHDAAEMMLGIAETVLKPFHCTPELKKFQPEEVPIIFSTGKEGRFFRSLDQSREVANPLWGGVLDDLAGKSRRPSTYAQLCFNHNNELVQRLVSLKKKSLIRRSIEMLYVQGLLLAHQPLSSKEIALLNEGLLALIELGISTEE